MEQDNLKGREYLKSKFRDGDRPDGTDFSDLIDSCINQKSDRIFALDGKMGIATDKPKAPLEIKGGRRKTRQTLLVSDGSNSSFRIAHPEARTAALGANNGESLALGTFVEDGSEFTPRISMDAQGKLGIGTESPRELLDVCGSINVDQSIFLGTAELYFKKGELMLLNNGRKYRVLMEEIHHHHHHPERRRVLMWLLIIIGSLIIIGIAIVIYLLLTNK